MMGGMTSFSRAVIGTCTCTFTGFQAQNTLHCTTLYTFVYMYKLIEVYTCMCIFLCVFFTHAIIKFYSLVTNTSGHAVRHCHVLSSQN